MCAASAPSPRDHYPSGKTSSSGSHVAVVERFVPDRDERGKTTAGSGYFLVVIKRAEKK
jgi:hypothetical protein